jgi:hypothetical protein
MPPAAGARGRRLVAAGAARRRHPGAVAAQAEPGDELLQRRAVQPEHACGRRDVAAVAFERGGEERAVERVERAAPRLDD